jgi:hypothetical protein
MRTEVKILETSITDSFCDEKLPNIKARFGENYASL